jgi:hypothetical protein
MLRQTLDRRLKDQPLIYRLVDTLRLEGGGVIQFAQFSVQAVHGLGMAQTESNTHSFIVKIWLENSSETSGRVRWRGRILHVPDHAARHFESLNVIALFIAPYLKAMGANPGIGWRMWGWLKNWRRLLNKKV